jgi:uncharacterized protein (DUF1499 family)
MNSGRGIGDVLLFLLFLATVGWVGYRWLKGSDDPGRLITKWILSAFLVFGIVRLSLAIFRDGLHPVVAIPAITLLLLILGVTWAASISGYLAGGLTNAIDGGNEEIEARPCYSAAESKRSRGQYREAIAELQIQLSRFPNDYTGQVMLAQIQAEHLNDLETAKITIERLVNQKNHLPAEISAALNQLADWHLKFGIDPDSARDSLARIVAAFPGSYFAQTALQRIAHLASMDQLVDAADRPAIPLRRCEGDIGLRPPEEVRIARKDEEDPGAVAARYVKHLEEHPSDTEAREKLAGLYAGHYKRPDLAIYEIEHMLLTTQALPQDKARWLNLIADWQIRHFNDPEAARATLQRIVLQSPHSPNAAQANTRINYLNLEMKGKQKSQVIKLGSYEKDLGLKKR